MPTRTHHTCVCSWGNPVTMHGLMASHTWMMDQETCTPALRLRLRMRAVDLISRAGLMESRPTKLSGGTRIPPTLMHSSRRHLFTSATSPPSVTWRQLHRMMLCHITCTENKINTHACRSAQRLRRPSSSRFFRSIQVFYLCATTVNDNT